MIDSKTWMAENLSYLPQINMVEDGVYEEDRFWVYGYYKTSIEEAKNTYYYKKYGVLYNWSAAMSACPDGWHLPNESQWQEMEKSLGMNSKQVGIRKWRDSGEVGSKLKAVIGWYRNSGNNVTGFTALPGGCKGYNGFESIGYCGYFWVGTPTNSDNAFRRALIFDGVGIERNEDRRYFGCSVRCVENN
jgi:uncharacterized protein (TIGR02145 family)